MRKLMRICGVLAALLLLLAAALVMTGRLGGQKAEWGKRLWNEEWQTYELSDSGIFDPEYPIVQDGNVEQDFEAGEISGLRFSLGGCELTLRDSGDGRFHVTAQRVEKFQVYAREGILCINSLDGGSWEGISWGNGLEGTGIVVEIPAGTVFESIEMELGAGKFTLAPLAAAGEAKLNLGGGDFSVESLRAASVCCGLGAGKLFIGSLAADSLDCDIGAGQMIVENAVITGNADLDMGMGTLRFTGTLPADLNASCSMGQMRLCILESGESDHNYDLECAAGSLRVGGSSYTGIAGKKIDNGAQTSLYRLECALGELEITFED